MGEEDYTWGKEEFERAIAEEERLPSLNAFIKPKTRSTLCLKCKHSPFRVKERVPAAFGRWRANLSMLDLSIPDLDQQAKLRPHSARPYPLKRPACRH